MYFMKKIYFMMLALLGTCAAGYANPGDTTIVQAHNLTQLSWYDNYDTAVTFPDGSVTYRKVIMEFTLGKYACPGYNPNNPGEGAGQTGWCSDWDYDVHLTAMVPGGDTMELARMITPYANSTFPRTPASWSHPYVFDVTDFYPLLKNNVTMRIFYSGYSGGFTGSVKFYFIEGTPARNVVKISNLWQGGYNYGHNTGSIDGMITAKTLTMPANALSAEMKVIITGHGGDNTENCAEFCKKWYQYKVNGNMVEQKDIWRDNCGSNFLYPQSGTWIYDRGNWCPGDLVHENIHKLPSSVTPGSTFTTDLDFQTYSSGNNGASYKVAAGMFFYGAFNHTKDAGLEQIISPNILEEHYRSNPVCGQPVVKIKNYGSTALTSVKFSYGIDGQTLSDYTWNGSMSSLNEAEITLPSIPSLNTATGNNNKFVVKIVEVNGSADEDIYNNELKSTFEAAPKWEGGNFRVDMKISASVQGYVNKVNWTIKDMSGNVMFQHQGTASSTQYLDTIHLENGCYRLDVDASYLSYGMRFFNAFSPGYFRIYNMANGAKLALPKTDLGSTGLEGNFGSGFAQYFTVQNSVTGIDFLNAPAYSISVYPNPAKNFIQLDVLGSINTEANIQLVNVLGQTVYSTVSRKQNITISTEKIANGIYTLIYNTGDSKKMEKVVIAK
jgi:hypothetical protein